MATLNVNTGDLVRLPRQRMRLGRIGDSCPAGQVMTNTPTGTKCCGAPGTPAIADPCSYFNVDPAYEQLQQQVTQEAIATSPSFADFENVIGSFPQNIQFDATTCEYSPGATFVDQWGQKVTCPSPSTIGPTGAPMSSLSLLDLAKAIAANTPSPNVATNQPAPSNVLNNVAPMQLVPGTSTPPVNALTQTVRQTQPATPSAAAIAAGQTQSANAGVDIVNTSGAGAMAITDWITQNWVLLAAGAAALFLLPKLLEKR